jgi:hypothetical protein
MSTDNRPTITWDSDKLKRLKAAYRSAVRAGLEPDDVFSFEGNDFVVAYAFHLIEYLTIRLGL